MRNLAQMYFIGLTKKLIWVFPYQEKPEWTFWQSVCVCVCAGVCVYVCAGVCAVAQLCTTLCNPMNRSMIHRQASLSITSSQSSPKLMSIESVMPSSHLILCRPLLLLPPIPPSIRIFSNKSTLRMRWPKYWSFSLSISPSSEHPGLVSYMMDWLDLLAV